MKIKFTGFTLLELLISIALISIILTVTMSIVLVALRSASKTDIATNIRQAGNYVTQQVSDMVRYAYALNGVSTDGTAPNTTTNCVGGSGTYHYVYLTTQTGDALTLYCDSSAVAAIPIASNSASLIDTTKVTVSSCNFTCKQTSITSSPEIGINLTLTQKTSSDFSESKINMSFSSNTVMQNVHN